MPDVTSPDFEPRILVSLPLACNSICLAISKTASELSNTEMPQAMLLTLFNCIYLLTWRTTIRRFIGTSTANGLPGISSCENINLNDPENIVQGEGAKIPKDRMTTN